MRSASVPNGLSLTRYVQVAVGRGIPLASSFRPSALISASANVSAASFQASSISVSNDAIADLLNSSIGFRCTMPPASERRWMPSRRSAR